jgi:hypothetical protein
MQKYIENGIIYTIDDKDANDFISIYSTAKKLLKVKQIGSTAHTYLMDEDISDYVDIHGGIELALPAAKKKEFEHFEAHTTAPEFTKRRKKDPEFNEWARVKTLSEMTEVSKRLPSWLNSLTASVLSMSKMAIAGGYNEAEPGTKDTPMLPTSFKEQPPSQWMNTRSGATSGKNMKAIIVISDSAHWICSNIREEVFCKIAFQKCQHF